MIIHQYEEPHLVLRKQRAVQGAMLRSSVDASMEMEE